MPRYSRTAALLPRPLSPSVPLDDRHDAALALLPVDFFRSKKLNAAVAQRDFETFAQMLSKKLARRMKTFLRKFARKWGDVLAAPVESMRELDNLADLLARDSSRTADSPPTTPRSRGRKVKNRSSESGEASPSASRDGLHGQPTTTQLSSFERITLLRDLLFAPERVADQKIARDWLAGWADLSARHAARAAIGSVGDAAASADTGSETSTMRPLENGLERLATGVADWGWSLLIADLSHLPFDLAPVREALRQEFDSIADEEGVPLTVPPRTERGAFSISMTEALTRFRAELALLSFATAISQPFGGELWEGDSHDRHAQFIRHALCWLDRADSAPIPLMALAIQTAGLKKSTGPRHWLEERQSGIEKPLRNSADYPLSSRQYRQMLRKQGSPSFQSDSGKKACLRSDWSPDSDRILAEYHGDDFQIEVMAAGMSLLRGSWGLELTQEGRSLSPINEWRCTCWFSDHEADYLELQRTYDQDVRIDRQILLSRVDGLSYWAETVVGPPGRLLEIKSSWPTAPGVVTVAEQETNSQRLQLDLNEEPQNFKSNGKKPKRKGQNRPPCGVRALALTLPCQSSGSSTASWKTGGENSLELSAGTTEGGMFLPVVFDSHPERQRGTLSWRPLTISEGGAIVPPQRAAAYLLQSPPLKLFVYRSIAISRRPRAALGHHTLHESVVGRFNTAGEIEPLVFVE